MLAFLTTFGIFNKIILPCPKKASEFPFYLLRPNLSCWCCVFNLLLLSRYTCSKLAIPFLLAHAEIKAFSHNIKHIENKAQNIHLCTVAKNPYFCMNQQKKKRTT